MNNRVNSGKFLEITAGANLASGQPVLVGSVGTGVVGIAASSYASGSQAVIDLWGRFTVAKHAGETWAIGQPLYWDNTNSVFTTTNTSNTIAGFAATAQLSADTAGDIILRQ